MVAVWRDTRALVGDAYLVKEGDLEGSLNLGPHLLGQKQHTLHCVAPAGGGQQLKHVQGTG